MKMHHVAAPVIETGRLRLRPFALSDLEARHAIWAEPAVYRYISGKPKPLSQTWSDILRTAGHWQLLGFGYWAVEHRETGHLIGEVGFGDFRREMAVAMTEPEMGWVFSTLHHGQGYGTEACRAAAKWGDENLGEELTACIIAPENTASNRLAQKLGFVKVAETTYENEPTWLFHRKRASD